MNITGFSSFGNGGGPNRARNHTFQPLEMLSFNKGRHFMKAGGELRAVFIDQTRPDTPRGTFNFDTAAWTGIDGVGNTGNEFAAFQLGLVRQSARVVADFITKYRLREWGAFFQDDFKATRNLTLNFGLRYMYFTPPYTSDDLYGAFVYWPGVLKSKLMAEIGVTVREAAALVREPAQLLITTSKLPDEARFRFEMARLDAVAPAMFTPFERH